MSKGNDKNVGSIEEDIKILKELMEDVELTFAGWVDILNEREKKALKNLLQDYTRQKQINEEHQKQNAELMKAINTVEKEKGDWIEECKKLREYIFIAPNLDEMTAIKYVSIQREAYIRGRAEEQKRASQIIHENYIPKQKIKDKIEEYKGLVDEFEKTDNTGRFKRTNSIDYYKLEAFEELLQESEDK